MAKKRVMWWNLPPEEIDELRDAGQLKAFTCVEYDDEEEEKTEEEKNNGWINIYRQNKKDY